MQRIIQKSTILEIRTPHFCAHCGTVLDAGVSCRAITIYTQDQFGKSYKTVYYCKNHKIKTYGKGKVLK